MRCFFNWCVAAGFLDHTPFRGLRNVRLPSEVVQPFRPAELARLVAACDPATAVGRRDVAVVLLFLDTGIRCAELSALDLADCDLPRGRLLIRHGKGNKQRVVPFARRCQAALEAYLAVRGRTPGPLVWAVTGPGQLRPGVRLQPNGLKQLLRRQRGFEVTHETVRAWEFRFAPLVSEQLRAKRRGRAGVSWYLDETYVKVGGRWCYLYRAIDHRGDLIDSMLSERRDKHAARRFLRRLVEVAAGKPARITTDLHPAYRRAIRWIIGRKAWHRTTQYLDNYTEQSHRGVKQRYYPMLGFGSFQSASRFCAAFDALRQYFRVRHRGEAHVPLAVERRLFLTHWRSLIGELATA